jgi:hypothetical protein
VRPRQKVDGKGDQKAIEEQRRAAQGEDRQWQRDARQGGPDECVEEADRGRLSVLRVRSVVE